MEHADASASISLIEPLTCREHDILRLMAEDLSAQEMAGRLYLSPSTVKWYARQIYGKLGIQESGQKRRLAVARARTLGLLEAERTPAGRLCYNLPVQTTPLVGRSRELHDIAALLANPQERLVTLLGPGGIGKTRLALEVAWRLVEPKAFGASWSVFPDGVYFVPLQPIEATENILWAVAEAVGYPFQRHSPEPLRQVLDFFREKRLLLVLDSFEHLLEGAVLVVNILEAAPGVQALVTSREALHLTAETVYRVEGLPFPARLPPNDMPDYDAARLFIQGARRALVGFELRPDERLPLARICQLVQGMPLALLLAAAWVEVLSLPEIAEEIARSFDFLAAEMRDAPCRQWSIRAVFEPTWERLTEAERAALVRLAVFRGGCTRQAAQAVTGASLPVLQALVNKAVLSCTPRGRYEIHELLRRYALERLNAAGETEAAGDAHCTYYAEFMGTCQTDLKGGDRQIAALDEIEGEFENVRAAWDWAIARRRVEDLARMEWAVLWFLFIRARYAEGLALFKGALCVEEDHALLGRIMAGCGFFSGEIGRVHEAEEWERRSLAIARETSNSADLAIVLRLMGTVAATSSHDFEQAYRCIDESLARFSELGDTWGIAWALHGKGHIARLEGNYPSALAFTKEAIRLGRIIGDRQRTAAALFNAGVDCRSLGEPLKSLRYEEDSLAVAHELNAPVVMARALGNVGAMAQHLGDYETALRRLEEGLALGSECGHWPVVSFILVSIADVLSLIGRLNEAASRLDECSRVPESAQDEGLQASVLYTKSMAAYRAGDYESALHWAQEGFQYMQAHQLTLCESLYWLLVGLAEICLDHLDAAREHICTSLPGLRNKDEVMRAIYGLAALEAADGQPERAVELAALAQGHRATEYEFKVYAGDLMAELQTTLPPDVYAAAVARGVALDPDAVIASDVN